MTGCRVGIVATGLIVLVGVVPGVAVADPPYVSPLVLQTSPDGCSVVRIPNDTIYRWHGAFDSHAADGALNAGSATAEPSPDSRSIYLMADATTGGNDAHSWAAGSTGYQVPIVNSTGTSAAIQASLKFRVQGSGYGLGVAFSPGSIQGVELGGTADSHAELVVRGFSQLVGSAATEGETTHRRVASNDQPVVAYNNTGVTLGLADVADTKTTILPTVTVPSGATAQDTRFYVRGNVDARVTIGGMTSTAEGGAGWSLDSDPSELETVEVQLKAPTGTTFAASSLCVDSAPNGDSGNAVVSSDGRYVAFVSNADNLVLGDDGWSDVFLRDTVLGTTTLVSVDSAGHHANGDSGDVIDGSIAISADGRYVAFDSSASNLVPNDTNGARDVFVRDVVAGATERVSVSSSGQQRDRFDLAMSPAISPDGRYVAFQSYATNLVAGDTNGLADVFLRDTVADTTTRVSVGASGQGNGNSGNASVSTGGHHVAFSSDASNLAGASRSCWNGSEWVTCRDVFVRDTVAGTTTKASLPQSGTQTDNEHDDKCLDGISADGRYVAWVSQSARLVDDDNNGDLDAFVRDTTLGTTTRVSVTNSGAESRGHALQCAISGDGRHVAWTTGARDVDPASYDSGYHDDVYVRDAVGGTSRRASLQADGTEFADDCYDAAISANGQYVTFKTSSSGVMVIYLRNMATNATVLVSTA